MFDHFRYHKCSGNYLELFIYLFLKISSIDIKCQIFQLGKNFLRFVCFTPQDALLDFLKTNRSMAKNLLNVLNSLHFIGSKFIYITITSA